MQSILQTNERQSQSGLDAWLADHRGSCGVTPLIQDGVSRYQYWLRGWYPNEREYGWWMFGSTDNPIIALVAWCELADMLDRVVKERERAETDAFDQ